MPARVLTDDKEWWKNLSDRDRSVVVEFVNRCKRNNFAIFDIFKVREYQKKTEIRESELSRELEQRNKDLAAFCIMCPWKSGTERTTERIVGLERQNAILKEKIESMRRAEKV